MELWEHIKVPEIVMMQIYCYMRNSWCNYELPRKEENENFNCYLDRIGFSPDYDGRRIKIHGSKKNPKSFLVCFSMHYGDEFIYAPSFPDLVQLMQQLLPLSNGHNG